MPGSSVTPATAAMPVTTRGPESGRCSQGESPAPGTRAGPGAPLPEKPGLEPGGGHPAFAGDAFGEATRPRRVVGLPAPPGTPVPRPHSPGGEARSAPAPAPAPAAATAPLGGGAAAAPPCPLHAGGCSPPPARPTASISGREAMPGPGYPAPGGPFPPIPAALRLGPQGPAGTDRAVRCASSAFMEQRRGSRGA